MSSFSQGCGEPLQVGSPLGEDQAVPSPGQGQFQYGATVHQTSFTYGREPFREFRSMKMLLPKEGQKSLDGRRWVRHPPLWILTMAAVVALTVRLIPACGSAGRAVQAPFQVVAPVIVAPPSVAVVPWRLPADRRRGS